MNIEAYDADSLRKMVRLLEYENKILKDKLKKAGISYEEVNPFEEKIESAEEYDLDQGDRIVNPPYITEKMAIRFFSMFWGREDVYARRGKNGGYCNGIFNHTSLYQYHHGKLLLHLILPFEKRPKGNQPGEYLRYYRLRNNLTTRQLAEQVGIVFRQLC